VPLLNYHIKILHISKIYKRILSQKTEVIAKEGFIRLLLRMKRYQSSKKAKKVETLVKPPPSGGDDT
jgi:hypothetical protein